MSVNKRLLKEIKALYAQQNSKQLLENDFLVYLNETDTSKVSALIKAPYDSVYRHKFIRLDLVIPDNYPHSPPEVSFINYDGVRIHPNMYENGKCCATILNTWGDSKLEKWTSSMGIETILVMFHSFLDNNPYTYEPGGHDDPSYTVYVEYQSWNTCLIRYVQYERNPLFTEMIHNYLMLNVGNIMMDIDVLEAKYPLDYYHTRCFEVDDFFVNYDSVRQNLLHIYQYIDFVDNFGSIDEAHVVDYKAFLENIGNYKCSICYDTSEGDDSVVNTNIVLECGHKFHKLCLDEHVEQNTALCPMCRQEVKREVTDGWIVNPITNRRIRVGGKTWLWLKENGKV
jgi:ubiquitin-protein ligase